MLIHFATTLSFKNYWDFRGALHRKSLCFFFRANLQISQPEPEIAITLKRLKVKIRNLDFK